MRCEVIVHFSLLDADLVFTVQVMRAIIHFLVILYLYTENPLFLSNKSNTITLNKLF